MLAFIASIKKLKYTWKTGLAFSLGLIFRQYEIGERPHWQTGWEFYFYGLLF